MKSRSFFSILFVLFSVTSFTQEQKFLALDSLFQILDENNRFMGSLSISENGKVTYNNTIGKADLASRKSSNFVICSKLAAFIIFPSNKLVIKKSRSSVVETMPPAPSETEE